MGTIFNTKIFKGVSINGQEVKGLVKNSVIFYIKPVLDPTLILKLDFQNSFIDDSSSGLSFIAGSSDNLPTFIPSGRKVGEYCAVFNGSQSIKTTSNLPINSDKVTVEFGMKTTQTTISILLELSENMNTNNSFGFWTNNGAANTVDGLSKNSNYNTVCSVLTHNNSWNHIAMVIDRTQNAVNEIKLYINGNLATVTKPFSTDNIGNFLNNILYIGQRGGNAYGYNGALMYLKIYNSAKTAGQVSTANSEFVALGVGTPPTLTGQKVALMGDSTIAAYACRSESVAQKLLTPTEITDGWSAVNLAVPGHTINQQLSVWNTDLNKSTYDIIIVQTGLNDMNTATATTLTNYQNLINQINATKKAGAKVYISCMLPCKQRFVDLGMATGQSNWVALNNAIMDSTFTGVDKRNNYHVSLLDDGNGNLAAAYNCGDHIHENQAGADIIITGFRNMIF